MTEVDTHELSRLVRDHRNRRGLSLRAAADESGVPFNTLSRVERGYLPDLPNFARLAHWAGFDYADVLGAPARRREATTPEVVRAALHADPLLSEEAEDRISDLVDQLYRTLARQPDVITHVQVATTLTPRASELTRDVLASIRERVECDVFEPGWAAYDP